MDRMMDRIKYYRQRSGQTQAQVANKLGMAVSNYQKYELGAREPLEKNLPALADALGCSAYSLQESDKERFIRIYNKFVREAAMHRWDSYTFNAEEFLAYDIGEDIMGYFVEYFNQIETVNPELYRRWQFVTNYPDALFNVLDLLEQAQKATQRGALEADFRSLITREHPVYFWYFIIFGYIFLNHSPFIVHYIIRFKFPVCAYRSLLVIFSYLCLFPHFPIVFHKFIINFLLCSLK